MSASQSAPQRRQVDRQAVALLHWRPRQHTITRHAIQGVVGSAAPATCCNLQQSVAECENRVCVQAKRESRRQNAERWAAEVAARREQVAAVRADNATLQQRVDSQPYTAEQAARMNAEKCVLKTLRVRFGNVSGVEMTESIAAVGFAPVALILATLYGADHELLNLMTQDQGRRGAGGAAAAPGAAHRRRRGRRGAGGRVPRLPAGGGAGEAWHMPALHSVPCSSSACALHLRPQPRTPKGSRHAHNDMYSLLSFADGDWSVS